MAIKKFHFSLQKLLELREAREQEIKHELARLLAKQNAERVLQDTLRNAIEHQGIHHREKMLKGTARVDDAILFERFVNSSLRAIDAAEVKIRNMEPGIQEVRDRLVIASRERKIVDKLRERKLEEYTYMVNRETAKENDDMNQKIYGRRDRNIEIFPGGKA